MHAGAGLSRELWRRIAGFGGAPLLAVAGPIVALPILARSVSIAEWAAIAIGQSLGGLASFVVSWGWTVLGPGEVARTEAEHRAELWVLSLRSRAMVLLCATPVVLIASILLAPAGARLLTAACAFTGAALGLSLSWFAIGANLPRQLALFDAVPRAVGSLAGAALVFGGAAPLCFPVTQMALFAVGLAAFTVRHRPTSPASLRAGGRISRHSAAMAAEVAASAYSMGAVALVSIFGSVQAVAVFSAGERLMRWAAAVIGVVGNGLQGWVGEARAQEFRVRVQRSFALHGFVGVAGFLVIAGLAPTLTAVAFGQALAASRGLSLTLGFFYLLWSFETVTARHILASRGAARSILLSTIVGSGVGLLLIAEFSARFGAVGAAIGMTCGLATILVLQAAPALKLYQEG